MCSFRAGWNIQVLRGIYDVERSRKTPHLTDWQEMIVTYSETESGKEHYGEK